MSGAVVAVTQWLVRATDDRVVTASNPVRLPHIAWGTALPVSFGDTIRPSVPSIMVSMMGDVNIGVDAAKAACWSTRDREARRLELTPGAKTIHVFRACLGAQLTICAQKWRNFVLFSTVSLRFVLSRVCVFLYSLGPRQWQYTVSNKSLDFYALLCAHCNCSPVPVTSVIKLLIYVHNLLFVFVCKKVAKLISIWLKKIWTFSHIG